MATPTVRLSSGHDMPVVGLGTWQAKSEEMEDLITNAFSSGYRHIDTAFNYNNEEAIGKSLKQWFNQGGKRDQVFITTKLPNFGNRPSDVEKFIKLSLQRLGLDYVDLYLVHMPFAFIQDKDTFAPATNANGTFALDLESDPVAVWKEMEKQVKAGRTKSIGLSNFNISQIQNILNNSEIKPSNIQIELHAYMQQRPIREFCRQHNISVTGYSPIASPGAKQHFQTKYNYSADKFPDLLGHPMVKEIAETHNKTTAQVLLRHAVQGGVIVIPKSSNPGRIKSNIEIFDFSLTDEEMHRLNSLDQAEVGRIFNFLFFKGVENHPQYPFRSELK
ncbi:aldo-keto reductase family 1 member A1 isoform X8 [Phymastichus coffea]|nr:aldo-keto reductase family 1 member A1 isoform X8 [Phymastichus coffea]XP_058799849.1 aldo-keto reductase family 1 member A1 isoform X8 [Phymastichus coffea]XP_058799850.1 aldo-keto reductase family 1 member A1 isoform X8 [Phymastichus coffea]